MVDMIPGSSVDILSKDASNIVEIVKTKYDQVIYDYNYNIDILSKDGSNTVLIFSVMNSVRKGVWGYVSSISSFSFNFSFNKKR